MIHWLFAAATAGPLVELETDPSTFAFHGGALHVRAALPGAERWAVGLGAYALRLPQPMVALSPANRGEGWTADLFGAGLFVDRYVSAPFTGLSIGAQVAVHRWSLARPDVADGDAVASAILAMPRVGWSWTPFDRLGLYVYPWLGLGLTGQIGGDAEVGGAAYRIGPVLPFAAVHVGWRFGA
ncbi:MAG: hypothetical protein ABMB14_28585 [Myxococcota bacterium]